MSTRDNTRDETRFAFGAPAGLAYRAAGDEGGPGSLTWRAPVFGVLSEDFGGWRELVLPSSVKRTMGRPTQIAQYNHTTMIASRAGGTLEAEVDADGVRFTAALADTYVGQHVATMADRGDLTGASFTFTLKAPSYWATLGELRANGIAGVSVGEIRLGADDHDGVDPPDDLIVRVLTEVALWESGPVDMPAYPEPVVSRARAGAAAELHAARGIPVDELGDAMAERRLGELIRRAGAGAGAPDAPTGAPAARGMSLAVAREMARSRYASR